MGILCSSAPLKLRLAVHVGRSSSRLNVKRENLPKTDHPDLGWLCFLAFGPTVDVSRRCRKTSE
jgi:hypothetical protein